LRDNLDTTKGKPTEALIDASKEVGQEINTRKSKYEGKLQMDIEFKQIRVLIEKCFYFST
jgi:hypothetical protein